mgnify:CR=1 FL=1
MTTSTYLVLSQQRFNPNCIGGELRGCNTFVGVREGPHTGLNQNLFYGKPLYLPLDMTHFIYDGTKYNINLKSIQQYMAKHRTNAEAGVRNITDAHFRKYIYDVDIPEELYFEVIQVKDNNTYLHNKFEFEYVTFQGMRFEMIL